MGVERLQELRTILVDAQVDEDGDTEAQAAISHLQELGSRVSLILDGLDAARVLPGLLDRLEAALEPVASDLASYDEHGEPSDLQIALDHAENAYSVLAVVWPFVDAVEVDNLTDAASTVRRSAGQYLRGIKDDADAIEAELRALRDASTAREQSLAQELGAISTEVAALETRIEGGESRLDNAIAAFQAQFSTSQEERLTKFNDLTDTLRTQLEEAVSDEREELRRRSEVHAERLTEQAAVFETQADDILSRLQEMHASVTRVAAAVSDKLIAGEFDAYAKEQKTAADKWRRATVLFGFLAVVAALVFLVEAAGNGINPSEAIIRVGVTLAILGLAGYSGQQAWDHRRREHNARDIQLQLVSIDPFLANLTPEDRRGLKRRLGLRVFSGGDVPAPDEGWSDLPAHQDAEEET